MITKITPELRKDTYQFVRPTDTRFAWSGDWMVGSDGCVISKSDDATCIWSGVVENVVLALVCHDFSGIISLELGGNFEENNRKNQYFMDNYSWFSYWKGVYFCQTQPSGRYIRISAVGRNPLSKGEEIVIAGIFIPKSNSEFGDVIENSSPTDQDFEKLQSQMVDNWVRNIVDSGKSVEEVTRNRQAAYLKRWAEILPYIGQKSNVLDIGAGFLFYGLFEFFIKNNINYTAIDIDRRAVESNRENGSRFGFRESNFLHGTNSKLDIESDSHDLIFSSHCIEHSDDLYATFSEIKRVLKKDGILIFAVPTTVDNSAEHMYFFSYQDWITFVSEQDLVVINCHIGSVYPESGHDLVIVAKKP